MKPATLERAITAFCCEAGLDRSQVHDMRVGSKVVLWVSITPNEPSDVPAPRWPSKMMVAYA